MSAFAFACALLCAVSLVGIGYAWGYHRATRELDAWAAEVAEASRKRCEEHIRATLFSTSQVVYRGSPGIAAVERSLN